MTQAENDELALAWRDAVTKLGVDFDDERTRFFVSYNGPDDEWPWTAGYEVIGSSPPFAPVGWGDTPAGALGALVKAVEHELGYWPVTRPWDEQSEVWAKEEGFG